MRWWLGLAFAGVAALDGRRGRGGAEHAPDQAPSARTARSSQSATPSRPRRRSSATRTPRRGRAARDAIAAHQRLALFVFDATAVRSRAHARSGIQLAERPGREAPRSGPHSRATATSTGAATARRSSSGSASTAAPGGAVVAYSLRPELREQLGIVRHEFLQAALLAFAVGAALGLLIATLIARRLAAHRPRGEGDRRGRLRASP